MRHSNSFSFQPHKHTPPSGLGDSRRRLGSPPGEDARAEFDTNTYLYLSRKIFKPIKHEKFIPNTPQGELKLEKRWPLKCDLHEEHNMRINFNSKTNIKKETRSVRSGQQLGFFSPNMGCGGIVGAFTVNQRFRLATSTQTRCVDYHIFDRLESFRDLEETKGDFLRFVACARLSRVDKVIKDAHMLGILGSQPISTAQHYPNIYIDTRTNNHHIKGMRSPVTPLSTYYSF
ncbi:hypothetical protein RND71_028286 [Anisodus tanguticus]|uniref:Uncharacterized protein n=1 Tax=Anisodus tanguticus TaxID=243964 RepID=A0AAE1RJE1_9SOLA|nr:hypothetical protein RND71_028286 [Anisodus tanguticus]